MLIFYSYQSWLPNKTNRGFISDAIKKAMKKAEAEEKFLKLIPELEEDTRNVLGSPNIVATLFENLQECDVFIADVTPVAKDEKGHKIPNPNVLIELGFAASELGWERIICVFNKAYGEVEDLPFDIRQHLTATYELVEDADSDKKKTEKDKLVSIIASYLINMKNRFAPEEEYLTSMIMRQLYPLRIQIPVILWFYDLIEKNTIEEEFLYFLAEHMAGVAQKISNKTLPELMIDKSHALTTRQRLKCRKIIEITNGFSVRVSLILRHFHHTKQRALEKNILLEHSLSEYLETAIGVLKKLYGEKWLPLFDKMSNKHYPDVDEYLFGPQKKNYTEAEMRDRLYELIGQQYSSREEFEASIEENAPEKKALENEMKTTMARFSIEGGYSEKEISSRVWEFIQILRGDSPK